MIKVEKLEIQEFRGIRKLKLNLNGSNFAVCGPNGTGKSGIVDALEFALTGNISRLSGKGTGEISVKAHAPHVDSRNDPDKARVILTASIPSLGKQVTIERSVKTADVVKITPNDEEVRAVIAQVGMHPEFALTRRELIRYVLSAPGDRAKEVQTLLRLDEVEDLRTALQKIANACERQLKPLGVERTAAKDQLIKKLGIADLDSKSILEAVNPKRVLLGLAPMETLTQTSSLKDGLATVSPSKIVQHRISKEQAIADIRQAQQCLASLSSSDAKLRSENIKQKLASLKSEPAVLNSVERERLLNAALKIIENETCPVCDTEWEPGELQKKIATKLKHLERVAAKRREIETEIEPLSASLVETKLALLSIHRYGALAKPPIDATALKQHASDLETCRQHLESLVPVENSVASINFITTVPDEVTKVILAIAAVVKSIPEPTKQDAARDYLVSCQERLEAYQDIRRRFKKASQDAALSKSICDIYASVSTGVLNGVYKQVETGFKQLYKFMNRDDEDGFDAHLFPSFGKLGFDVDFYGRGYFPPGAYHSEGHQDSMGLCLYLALMRHLLSSGFTLAVLDDVLMSVDSGHRREVCNLLKERFPNTQFILTTHDGIWLRHMKTAGLIKPDSFIQFRRWNVNQGPTEWKDRDVWAEISSFTESNDILGASSVLRNYLEYISAEICNRLRARVEFRGDAQFMLGDLLPNATGQFRKLLREAKKAAQSWSQKAIFESIDADEAKFAEVVARSKVEEWQINPSIHYNEWANFQKEDFKPVISSQYALIACLRCEDCGGFFFVLPERGTPQSLRCDCGKFNLNLTSK